MIGKIFSGIVAGLVVSIMGSMLITMALAGNDPVSGGETGGKVFFIFWILSLIIALTSPGAGKAWRRLLIIAGLLAFAMPLSSLIYTGSQISEVATQGSGAATVGTAIGGGLITAVSGIVGFFLGGILLIIGLLVGRDKQIVVIKESELKE